ncbi:unnamed protein product [Rotaria socialis]
MHLKTNSKRRRSIGERCRDFWSTLHKKSHSLGNFIYNKEHHELFGRDGKRWSKLAAFYFCFYVVLGGMFCLYLSIFMIFLPINQPRYIGKDSQLTSRSNPFSPGLSIRPQVRLTLKDPLALIWLSSSDEKYPMNDNIEMYTKNLDDFLNNYNTNAQNSKNFTIHDVGDCNSNNHYGYTDGKPCILIKINKLIGFIPEVRKIHANNRHDDSECIGISNIPVRCMGENPFDQDMIGKIQYYSESESSDVCGSIDIKHFPYNGKDDRNNVYQTPYAESEVKYVPNEELKIVNEQLINDFQDRCASTKCRDGETCILNKDGDAECACVAQCEDPKDERLMVCTKANHTYTSDCEFYQMQCWCRRNDERCTRQEAVSDSIDYFGRCQNLGICTAFELEVFPKRMTTWLGEILDALFVRKDLDAKYEVLVNEARKMKLSNTEKWWRNAVLWEFCELDRTHDNSVNNEEIARFVRSLKVLEHCIQPFLNHCDTDNDNKISSEEWGTCLGLEKGNYTPAYF